MACDFAADDLVGEVLCEFVAECVPRQVRAFFVCEKRKASDVVGAEALVSICVVELCQILQFAKNRGAIESPFLRIVPNVSNKWCLVTHPEQEIEPEFQASIAAVDESYYYCCEQRHQGTQQQRIRFELNRGEPCPCFGKQGYRRTRRNRYQNAFANRRCSHNRLFSPRIGSPALLSRAQSRCSFHFAVPRRARDLTASISAITNL